MTDAHSLILVSVISTLFFQLVLFGEIMLAQKVMYEKFGDDFLVHFVSKGFPSAYCPQNLAEQYCQKLKVLFFVIYLCCIFCSCFSPDV